jgi:hypothetical protein
METFVRVIINQQSLKDLAVGNYSTHIFSPINQSIKAHLHWRSLLYRHRQNYHLQQGSLTKGEG